MIRASLSDIDVVLKLPAMLPQLELPSSMLVVGE